jgi:uncharacterized protein YggE
MDHEPAISVKGVGKVSFPPDLTVILFEISSHGMEYAAAVEELNDRVAALRDCLSRVDIDPKRLKTTQYNVDTKHRWVKDEHIFDGWVARHDLRLELPVDRDELNRAFKAITSNEIQAEFRVHFEVEDKAVAKEAVLKDATEKAHRHAQVIASAAGCRLGGVLKIDYGWSEVRFRSMDYPVQSAGMDMAASCLPDIEPEEIEASESVTVVWELLGK